MGGGTGAAEEQAGQNQVTLRFHLRPWQAEARRLLQKYPYLVVSNGVYSGKTVWGSATLLEDMYRNPGKTFWWVAALDWQIKRFWEVFEPAAKRLGSRTKESPHCYAELPNGARVHGVTAKSIDSLSAYHPYAIYGDEIAKLPGKAWNLVRIRMIKCKRVILMSTPRDGFWADLIKWGKTHRHNKWSLVSVSTQQAGIISEEELAQLKEDLPFDLYRQEVLAQIVKGAGLVFGNVEACAVGAPEEPQEGKRYLITYDPAKLSDFGWATVWDDWKVVYSDCWEKADYRYQAGRLAAISRHYNCADIFMDRTGPGEPVYEMVCEEALKKDKNDEPLGEFAVDGLVFDNLNKQFMVNEAIKLFEKRQLILVAGKHGDVYEKMIEQLNEYERQRSRSGLAYTYSAPIGKHDDAVTTVLLRAAGSRVPSISFA